MAIEHISQAYKLDLGYSLKFIMVTLADQVDDSDCLTIVPSEIIKRLGMPEQIFLEHLITLRGLGYIKEQSRHEPLEAISENFDDCYFLEWIVGGKKDA